MKMYLVYSNEYHKEMVEYEANLMMTYASIPVDKHGSVTIPSGFKDVLIDSGGFQLQTGVKGGRDISVSGYSAWLQYALPLFPEIKGYMAMDVMNDTKQTLKNLDYMKSEGLKPLPVWHPNEGWDLLTEYCSEYEYVAVGGIAGKRKNSSGYLKKLFDTILTTYTGNRFHFLGVGLRAGVALRSYRPYSIDFSTWLNVFRFGNHIVWTDDGMLVEKRMSPEDSLRIKKDPIYRRNVVTEVLENMKLYLLNLEELHDPIDSQLTLDIK
jgi:hypothetical protein